MVFIELIPHLRTKEKAQALLSKECPNIDHEFVEIYMVNELSTQSEIKFFDNDETSYIKVVINGVLYVNLLSFNQTQEMVESFGYRYSDIEIAERILEYSINDA